MIWRLLVAPVMVFGILVMVDRAIDGEWFGRWRYRLFQTLFALVIGQALVNLGRSGP